MAAGDLTITLTESIELAAAYGGETRAYTNTKTISNIVNTFHRVVKCTNDENTVVATFNSNAYGANQALDLEGTKYVRFTNLDGSNDVHIMFKGASDTFSVTLDPGHSYMMTTPDDYMLGSADVGSDYPLTGTLEDCVEISIRPTGSAVVNIEMFAAGIAPA